MSKCYGYILPEIMESDKLKWPEKVLLSEIISLSKQRNYCFMKNSTFSRKMNVSVRTIQRYLKKLISLQLINVLPNNKKDSEGNYYTDRKIFVADNWITILVNEDLKTEEPTPSPTPSEEIKPSSENAFSSSGDVTGGMTKMSYRDYQMKHSSKKNEYICNNHSKSDEKSLTRQKKYHLEHYSEFYYEMKCNVLRAYDEMKNDGIEMYFSPYTFLDTYFSDNGKYFNVKGWNINTFHIKEVMMVWNENNKMKLSKYRSHEKISDISPKSALNQDKNVMSEEDVQRLKEIYGEEQEDEIMMSENSPIMAEISNEIPITNEILEHAPITEEFLDDIYIPDEYETEDKISPEDALVMVEEDLRYKIINIFMKHRNEMRSKNPMEYLDYLFNRENGEYFKNPFDLTRYNFEASMLSWNYTGSI